jgi:hypothetical protein
VGRGTAAELGSTPTPAIHLTHKYGSAQALMRAARPPDLVTDNPAATAAPCGRSQVAASASRWMATQAMIVPAPLSGNIRQFMMNGVPSLR